MSDFNMRDKSRNYWKALEYIGKLSANERMEIASILVTVDFHNPNSKTGYKTECCFGRILKEEIK